MSALVPNREYTTARGETGPVLGPDVEVSEAAVRGQLAGLTMCLKNPIYGFAQTTWPVTNTWLPGGFAS